MRCSPPSAILLRTNAMHNLGVGFTPLKIHSNKVDHHELPSSSMLHSSAVNCDVDSSWFWPGCPDREQTASVVSALGQIKIETLNYSERLLQAVWIPKWFSSLTHYDSSQAVLINVTGSFSDCIWSQVWHITCAQQLKLALFAHTLESHFES